MSFFGFPPHIRGCSVYYVVEWALIVEMLARALIVDTYKKAVKFTISVISSNLNRRHTANPSFLFIQ